MYLSCLRFHFAAFRRSVSRVLLFALLLWSSVAGKSNQVHDDLWFMLCHAQESSRDPSVLRLQTFFMGCRCPQPLIALHHKRRSGLASAWWTRRTCYRIYTNLVVFCSPWSNDSMVRQSWKCWKQPAVAWSKLLVAPTKLLSAYEKIFCFCRGLLAQMFPK